MFYFRIASPRNKALGANQHHPLVTRQITMINIVINSTELKEVHHLTTIIITARYVHVLNIALNCSQAFRTSGRDKLKKIDTLKYG